MQWDLLEQKHVLKTVPFTVEELSLRDRSTGKNVHHPYHRLLAADWVNVLPVTSDRQVVLIRQSRAGTLGEELETPGGMIDPGERDPTMAAVRELEEETGYSSQRLIPLGAINPNPALFNNRLHMFLAFNCELPENRKHFPDQGESIKVELFPIAELDQLVRYGRINSCLCALTILLAQKYL